ncbi:MAG: iron ABC transporter permease [Candidatus Methanomethylophilaceae archaeon]
MSEGITESRNDSGMIINYRKYTFTKILIVVIILIALVLAIGISVTIGDYPIAFGDVFKIIWNHICGRTYDPNTVEWWDDYIVWEERLPRIAAAVLCGVSLSVAGVAMQALMKNPLADPYTTGISSGAMVGVTIALTLGLYAPIFSSEMGLVFNAFLFGLIPSLVIVGVTRFKNTSPATVILAGLAMSFMFSAISNIILVGSEAETVQEVYRWMVGSLNNVVSSQIGLMAFTTILGSLFFLITAKQLNIITTGDTTAKSLGLDTKKYRSVSLILLSFVIAEVVSVTGIMGFVGLVVPHMVRMFMGSDTRYVIPGSMALGALLLVVSDILSRVIIDSGMPVGVILSFIGGPMFLFLIIKQRRDMW